ncbi:low molecular weight phosphotyrosine protein phosphatase 1-like [Condylostylus longicornis]|uniref:low molecular weight phosphotyrosine protein phosphatase 1-like n=1 Tax=Condylostylus longicornis TaxID=2530218 RepID=UPI00244DFBE6|nr:low molecular weight phosphotyrosine protein phosphatase 1-like [Condylostylus longicornis]
MESENIGNLKILFVCLGNSCRSPMAESILKSLIMPHNELNWTIDSAALRSWNVGCPPQSRCLEILRQRGLKSNHVGRKITIEDFTIFDYIFGMDEMNMAELKELAPSNSKAKIKLLGLYGNTRNEIIFDPYFERGVHGFIKCYDQILICCKNFISSQLSKFDVKQS